MRNDKLKGSFGSPLCFLQFVFSRNGFVGVWLAGDGDSENAIAGKPASYRYVVNAAIQGFNANP
ncbi:hypothetical protein ACQR3P_18840 [Rhodococcus sp. IEGM1300]